jgi:hypothetical protein
MHGVKPSEEGMAAKKKKKPKITPALASKILRTVPHSEAFYFFNGVGEYTGKYTTSLDNFCNKIKTLELKSVLFHFNRQDFQKWIEGTIGDGLLANKVRRIKRSVEGEKVRTEIHRIVEQRLSQLKELLASQDAPVEHF